MHTHRSTRPNTQASLGARPDYAGLDAAAAGRTPRPDAPARVLSSLLQAQAGLNILLPIPTHRVGSTRAHARHVGRPIDRSGDWAFGRIGGGARVAPAPLGSLFWPAASTNSNRSAARLAHAAAALPCALGSDSTIHAHPTHRRHRARRVALDSFGSPALHSPSSTGSRLPSSPPRPPPSPTSHEQQHQQ